MGRDIGIVVVYSFARLTCCCCHSTLEIYWPLSRVTQAVASAGEGKDTGTAYDIHDDDTCDIGSLDTDSTVGENTVACGHRSIGAVGGKMHGEKHVQVAIWVDNILIGSSVVSNNQDSTRHDDWMPANPSYRL